MADKIPPLPPLPPVSSGGNAGASGLPSLPALPPLPPLPGTTVGGEDTKGFFDRLLSGAEDIVTGIPAGIKYTAESLGKDIWGITKGDFDFNRSRDIALEVIKQTAEDLRHPLRNPASTILSALSVASLGAGTAARASLAAKAIGEGATVGKAARAAAFPKPVGRVVKYEGVEPVAVGTYSRSALTRQIQKQLDKARESNPDLRLGLRTQRQRYGVAQKKRYLDFAQKADRALTRDFQSAVGGLTGPEQRALVYFAQNVPLDTRIEYHNTLVSKLQGLPEVEKSLRLADNERELLFLRSADKYVQDVNGRVEWKPGTEKLQDVYKKMEDLVTRNEEQLKETGLMTQAGLEKRTQAGAAVLLGAKFYSPEDFAKFKRAWGQRIKDVDKRLSSTLARFDTLRLERPGVAREQRRAGAAEAKATRLRERAPSARDSQQLLDGALREARSVQRDIDRGVGFVARLGELRRFFEGASPDVQRSLGSLELRSNADAFANAEAARGAALRDLAEFEDQLPRLQNARVAAYRELQQATSGLRKVTYNASRRKTKAVRDRWKEQLPGAEASVAAAKRYFDEAKAAEDTLKGAIRDARGRVRVAERERSRVTAGRERSAARQESDLARLRVEYEDLKKFYESYSLLFVRAAEIQERVIEHQTALRVARAKDAREASVIVADAREKLRKANDLHKAAIVNYVNDIEDLTQLKRSLEREIDAKAADVGKFVGGKGEPQARLFVPYGDWRKTAQSVFKIAGLGARGVVGVPKDPSFLKPFRGGLIAKGGGRWDQANLLAERRHEAIRYIYLLRFRNRLIEMASDTPAPGGVPMRNPVAIRLDAAKNQRIPAGIRAIIDNVDDEVTLNKQEVEALGLFYDAARKEFFDNDLSREAKLGNIGPVEGYKWIEKDMLGGLDVPSPMVGIDSGAARVFLKGADEINNLAKFVTLYLRPATIVPNILSGVALNLIQQGFLAPVNLARAFALNKSLGTYERMLVDEYMGEGSRSASLAGQGKGISARAVTIGATAFGKVQDVPFRRASFLHEARREGFRTNKELKDLLTKPENQDALFRVQDRANKAIIDYADLGPREAAFLKRLFYFYPWIKGATKYTGRFVQENPVQAGVYSQLGQMGAEQERARFGDVPFWARGLLQVGMRGGMPETVQTQGILPFTTGLESAQLLAGLGGVGRGPEAFLGNLSPVASALVSSLTGRTSLGIPLPKDQGPVESFFRLIAEGTPVGSAIKKLAEGTAGKTYPVSREDIVRQYLISTILAGRPTDVERLNALAELEKGR